jgi:hypothetical protein
LTTISLSSTFSQIRIFNAKRNLPSEELIRGNLL